MKQSDVFGREDRSVPDHSVPVVHVDLEIEKGEPDFQCEDPTPSTNLHLRKPWQERKYTKEQIGWLGDK